MGITLSSDEPDNCLIWIRTCIHGLAPHSVGVEEIEIYWFLLGFHASEGFIEIRYPLNALVLSTARPGRPDQCRLQNQSHCNHQNGRILIACPPAVCLDICEPVDFTNNFSID